MSTLQNHIKELNLKQLELLKRYHHLQRENDKLKKELNKQSIILEDKQKAFEELKSQLDILKISKGLMTEEEKKELNKKINVYLKDIDKCLSLINS